MCIKILIYLKDKSLSNNRNQNRRFCSYNIPVYLLISIFTCIIPSSTFFPNIFFCVISYLLPYSSEHNLFVWDKRFEKTKKGLKRQLLSWLSETYKIIVHSNTYFSTLSAIWTNLHCICLKLNKNTWRGSTTLQNLFDEKLIK